MHSILQRNQRKGKQKKPRFRGDRRLLSKDTPLEGGIKNAGHRPDPVLVTADNHVRRPSESTATKHGLFVGDEIIPINKRDVPRTNSVQKRFDPLQHRFASTFEIDESVVKGFITRKLQPVVEGRLNHKSVMPPPVSYHPLSGSSEDPKRICVIIATFTILLSG